MDVNAISEIDNKCINTYNNTKSKKINTECIDKNNILTQTFCENTNIEINTNNIEFVNKSVMTYAENLHNV